MVSKKLAREHIKFQMNLIYFKVEVVPKKSIGKCPKTNKWIVTNVVPLFQVHSKIDGALLFENAVVSLIDNFIKTTELR